MSDLTSKAVEGRIGLKNLWNLKNQPLPFPRVSAATVRSGPCYHFIDKKFNGYSNILTINMLLNDQNSHHCKRWTPILHAWVKPSEWEWELNVLCKVIYKGGKRDSFDNSGGNLDHFIHEELSGRILYCAIPTINILQKVLKNFPPLWLVM